MATAKLWWNGSSWSSSEDYWLNGHSGDPSYSYSWVKYNAKVIATDEGTLSLEITVTPSHGDAAFGGSKTIKVDGTTVATLTNSNRSATVSISSPTATIAYSGSLTVRRQISGQPSGAAWSSSGSTTLTDCFRTITFNANGGSGAPAQWYTTDGSVTIPSTIPTRTGYTFLGWSESSSATTASYSAGGTASLSGDVTLYAVWQANSFSLSITKPNTATVTILQNGSAFSGSTVYYDDVLTITVTPAPGYRTDTLTVNGSAFVSGSTHTVTGNVAIVVTTIAQSSTIANYNSSVQTQQTFTLTANRYSTDHYNRLRYYDSNNNLLYTSDVFTDSTSLTIPRTWFTNFGTVTTITITAVLTTYTDSGGTTGHETGVTDSCTFTVTADSGMKPTLASGWLLIFPSNTTPGAGSLSSVLFVKGFSKVEANFTANKITHAVGASLGSYFITVQGVTTSGTNTTLVSSNTLTTPGALQITAGVTDSRGRTTSQTRTISVSDYAAPAIAALECFRCDSGGTEDENGGYMSVKATCTFTAISDNALTITAEVKPTGGSYTSYGSLTNATASVIGGSFQPDVSYFIKITVTDTLGTSVYTELSMPRRTWEFHIMHDQNGSGAAFGKIAETANVLQLASGWSLKIGNTVLSEADLIRLLALLS